MRKLGMAIFSAVLFAIASPVIAGNRSGAQGCSPHGTWLGFDENGVALWMSSVYGQSSSSGLNHLELPGFDFTLDGAFPDAARAAIMRGAWERVDGNEFNFTMLTIVVSEPGDTQWIAKLSGHVTLVDGCSREYVENTLEVYLPGMNPLQDKPVMAIPLPGHYGYRVSVQPPAM